MKVYNVTRFRIPALLFSLLCIAGFWIYTFAVSGGFNFGIDFRAGLVLNVNIPQKPTEQEIRDVINNLTIQVQRSVNTGEDFQGMYLIRVSDKGDVENFRQETTDSIVAALKEKFGEVVVESEDYVSSGLSAALAGQTLWVTMVALGLILAYVWIRFKLNYAVSAILAIFHDVFFLLGFIGIMQLEFSTATIAAVITIIGYSLNDTIVIFDRVRENTRIVKEGSFEHVVNLSITQSLSRTLITSVTTLLAIVTILYFSQGSIQIFALNLVVGVLVGTYSSIFVASPILLWWHNLHASKISEKNKKQETSHQHESQQAQSQYKFQKTGPQTLHIQQTAEEIEEATKRRMRIKSKKKKKKKR